MIFLFGHRGKKIYSKQNCHGVCANCGVDGRIAYEFYRRYIHVFFLPLFPTEKTSYAICQACGFTPELKQLTQRQKDAYQEIRKEAKTPIWMWLGTLFIGLLVCSFFFIGSNGIGDVAQVKSPEVGDVYTFSSGRFGSFDRMKIKSIDEGIAWFVPLPQEIETSRLDAYTSDVEETMDPIPVSFSSLKAMYMKGEIENVSRPLFFK